MHSFCCLCSRISRPNLARFSVVFPFDIGSCGSIPLCQGSWSDSRSFFAGLYRQVTIFGPCASAVFVSPRLSDHAQGFYELLLSEHFMPDRMSAFRALSLACASQLRLHNEISNKFDTSIFVKYLGDSSVHDREST